ncbi:MAG: cytochrome d ubiquinol oxidase subunit II [Thermodesulfobacteriota bacterium]
MLETIWFALWGVLWAIYFVLDGFDLGLGSLLPALARSEQDKRVIYNAMGPFWDGNEVWLITAGGVTFAAFPGTYAVMFSALYSALMLLLFALILRGVAFEFRGKVDSPAWKGLWDVCLWLGSFLPALLLGVAFANIFMGIQIDKDGVYQGTLFSLLNPYGLLGGVFFVVMFMVHGALWLAIKATGELEERARAMAKKLWPLLAILAVVFLVATWFYTKLWANYLNNVLLWVLPLLAVAGLCLSRVFMAQKAWGKAWGASALMIAGATLFGVAGLYPNLLPSSLDPAWSMTVSNSSSSPLTLKIMLGVALVMVPIVLAYQAWAYVTFRHKITDEDLAYEEAY